MKKYLLLMGFMWCSQIGFGQESECKPPKILEIKLTQDKKDSETQRVYFGGGYFINIKPASKLIFSNDMLAYIYGSEKNFVFHGDSQATDKNRHELLEAFDLVDDAEEDIMRRALNICDGEIYRYYVGDMDEIIIGVKMMLAEKESMMVYLFNDVLPFVEKIQFINYTDDEIEQVLATLNKVSAIHGEE